MSFILDALKKAEAERQRQTGPTLLEVRVTQPRRRFPLWIIIIGALLLINIVLLGLFALRHPQASSATASEVAPAPAAAPTPTPAPAPAPALATPAVSAVASPAAPPAAAPAAVPAVAAPAEMPASADRSGGGAVNRGAGADADAGSDNPADFEPAVPASGTAATRGQHAEPPSLSDIGGNLPDLRLDLHVYAARPADRYALINMHRVHEGDVLPEGPRVLAIDRDGVELSYRGTEFMLRPQ
jgi:general secretion pathway protein B